MVLTNCLQKWYKLKTQNNLANAHGVLNFRYVLFVVDIDVSPNETVILCNAYAI